MWFTCSSNGTLGTNRIGIDAEEDAGSIVGTGTSLAVLVRSLQRVAVETASAVLAVASGGVVLADTLT